MATSGAENAQNIKKTPVHENNTGGEFYVK